MVGEKSIRYAARVMKDGDPVATGSLTVACIDKRPGAPFRSTPIPAAIAGRFEVAPPLPDV